MGYVRAIGLVFGLLAAVSAEVAAQQAGGFNPRELFEQLDANNDRVIEREEVPEGGRDAFARLLKHGDANHNGKLEADEYRALLRETAAAFAARGAIPPERFAAMDRNGDGKLSQEEYQGPKAIFSKLDADRDGFVSKEEAARRPQGWEGPRPGVGAGPEAPARFRALDANRDGKLSRDEFKGPAAVFNRLDANRDGSLTLEELRAARPNGPAKQEGPAKKARE